MQFSRHLLGSSVAISALGLAAAGAAPGQLPQPIPNPDGTALTVTKQKKLDPENLYFQELGVNGRTCNTCHREDSGWSITPARIQEVFASTEGLDPLFRPNDSTNSPGADVSTLPARQAAYSMLLNRGVIRVGLPIPVGAEFELLAADDPYGFSSAAELSLFRRPLPAANLKFQSTVMWDGRQSPPDRTLAGHLAAQASDATTGHAQAPQAPTTAELEEIVDFETALFHAQATAGAAGATNSGGAKGGPSNLAKQRFSLGINNPFPPPGSRTQFNPLAITVFDRWKKPKGVRDPGVKAAREAVARGQIVFNEKRFSISQVAGLNDELNRPVITGTCTTCHNAPNVGTSSINALQDIGISAAARRTPEQPLYTLRNLMTQETRQTTDPGRALITGKWKDVDKFKVPGVRGLAARPPYFHDGSAATLEEVVEFYQTRFSINMSPQEKQDLVAFLKAL